jgi:hypothetical protein
MEIPGSVSSSATSPGDWADVLVPEPELDLLEGALDQERAERVHDRSDPGQRHPRADVDEQLLADADVDDPVGMAPLDVPEELAGDLGVDQGDRWVGVDQLGGRVRELLAGVHQYFSSCERACRGCDSGDESDRAHGPSRPGSAHAVGTDAAVPVGAAAAMP